MRVYLATTIDGLRAALDAGELDADLAYAVTPALREWYAESDEEELEYAAMAAAARASLRLLATDLGAPARRVVVAAEVPEARPDAADRAAVRLGAPVPWRQVAAAHVDDADAEDDVRRGSAALAAADAGDEDAAFLVDGVEDHELGWYATQELRGLVSP